MAGTIADDALASAVAHLVGRSRAFTLELKGTLREITGLRDTRADRLVAALELTLDEQAGSGTLREVEQLATALLRGLRETTR